MTMTKLLWWHGEAKRRGPPLVYAMLVVKKK
jgi:hypothetical protein